VLENKGLASSPGGPINLTPYLTRVYTSPSFSKKIPKNPLRFGGGMLDFGSPQGIGGLILEHNLLWFYLKTWG